MLGVGGIGHRISGMSKKTSDALNQWNKGHKANDALNQWNKGHKAKRQDCNKSEDQQEPSQKEPDPKDTKGKSGRRGWFFVGKVAGHGGGIMNMDFKRKGSPKGIINPFEPYKVDKPGIVVFEDEGFRKRQEKKEQQEEEQQEQEQKQEQK